MNWFKEIAAPAATAEEMPAVLAEEQRLRDQLFHSNGAQAGALTLYELLDNVILQRDEPKFDALVDRIHADFPEWKGVHHELLDFKGRLVALLGDWRRAIPYFERYHDESYDFEVEERRRVTAYIIEGLIALEDYTDIRTYIRRFVDYARATDLFEWDDSSIPDLCDFLLKIGETDWMLELALEWDSKSECAPDALLSYKIGEILYQKGDSLRAMHHFTRSLEADPTFFAAQYYMGMITWNELDDRARAIELMEAGLRNLQEKPERGPAFTALFYRGLQDMYFAVGRLDESTHFQQLFFESVAEEVKNGGTLSLHGDEVETFFEFLEKRYPGQFSFDEESGDFSAN